MEPTAVARAYYDALDDHDYGTLADLLASGFVQQRPDLTLEGRERFVRFMREERPNTDTTHAIHQVFESERPAAGDRSAGHDEEASGAGQNEGAADHEETAADREASVAVEGILRNDGGEQITTFVDVLAVADGRITALRTYTR